MMTMLCHFSGEAPDTEKYSDSDFVSALVYFSNVTSQADEEFTVHLREKYINVTSVII